MNFNVPVFEAPPSQDYKVKDGDKIDLIARKFGFKDHRPIWDAKENARLKQKRKKPEWIQAKDVLVIPPTPTELAKATVEHAKKLAAHLDLIAQAIARQQRGIKLMEQHKKDVIKDWGQVNAELEKMHTQAERWATGVDVAATVISLGRSIKAIVQNTGKAIKTVGEELTKLNKDIAKDLRDVSQDVVKEAVGKGLETFDEYQEHWVWFAFKVTEPSFYGWTIAAIIEGKSPSEALKSNPKTEHRDNLARVEKVKRQTLAMIDSKIARCQKIIELLRAGEREVAREAMSHKRR